MSSSRYSTRWILAWFVLFITVFAAFYWVIAARQARLGSQTYGVRTGFVQESHIQWDNRCWLVIIPAVSSSGDKSWSMVLSEEVKSDRAIPEIGGVKWLPPDRAYAFSYRYAAGDATITAIAQVEGQITNGDPQ